MSLKNASQRELSYTRLLGGFEADLALREANGRRDRRMGSHGRQDAADAQPGEADREECLQRGVQQAQ